MVANPSPMHASPARRTAPRATTRLRGLSLLCMTILIVVGCSPSGAAPDEIAVADLRQPDATVTPDVAVTATRAATDELSMLPASGMVDLVRVISDCRLFTCNDFAYPSEDVVLPAGTAFTYCLEDRYCASPLALTTRDDVVLRAGQSTEACAVWFFISRTCVRTGVSVGVEGNGPLPSTSTEPSWTADGQLVIATPAGAFDRGRVAGRYLSHNDVEAALIDAQGKILEQALPAALAAWDGAGPDDPLWSRAWSIDAVAGQLADRVDVAYDGPVSVHVLTLASIAAQVQDVLEERAALEGVTIDPATIAYRFHGWPDPLGSNGLPLVSASARVGTPTGPAPIPVIDWQAPPPELPDEPSLEHQVNRTTDDLPTGAGVTPPPPLQPLAPQPEPSWAVVAFDGVTPRATSRTWDFFDVEQSVTTSGTPSTVTEEDIERARAQVRQAILDELGTQLTQGTGSTPPDAERYLHLDGPIHVDHEPGDSASEVTARFDGTATLSWLRADAVVAAIDTHLFFEHGIDAYDPATITWQLYPCETNWDGLPCARGTVSVRQDNAR